MNSSSNSTTIYTMTAYKSTISFRLQRVQQLLHSEISERQLDEHSSYSVKGQSTSQKRPLQKRGTSYIANTSVDHGKSAKVAAIVQINFAYRDKKRNDGCAAPRYAYKDCPLALPVAIPFRKLTLE